MPLQPACLFARRAGLGRCLSPPSRAPGVELALGAERPWGMCVCVSARAGKRMSWRDTRMGLRGHVANGFCGHVHCLAAEPPPALGPQELAPHLS